jgi:hypothetical protein
MFLEHVHGTVVLVKNNPALAFALAALILALVFYKPREIGKFLIFGLFISVVFYFIILFTETLDIGSKQKDQMIHKSRSVIGE